MYSILYDSLSHHSLSHLQEACYVSTLYINYVKGANVAGFLKVAKAMMAQGIV